MEKHILRSLTAASLGLASLGAMAQTTNAQHAVKRSAEANQARVTLQSGDIHYYNTADLSTIDFDKSTGKVSVKPAEGSWTDTFAGTASEVSFAKGGSHASQAKIANAGVEITEADGWLESAYAKWAPLDGATSYHVYVKGGDYADFTRIDQPLVRNYGTYGRADMVGLKAGEYALKVVPVIGGTEDEAKASTASGLAVQAHDRSGFAHHDYSGVGAYNDDGTLKENTRVLYVTAATAKTVTLDVTTNNKGKTQDFTGLQAIINGYQKGYETRPLDVRLIGTLTDSDMDYLGSSAEGLQIKGKKNTTAMNITLEGIGDDAAIWGFGILMRNATSVELRNFAIMLCMDDAVSIDTDNLHCWVHHLDLFYGNTGGDSDQAKGDGTIDIKGDSQFITVSYNHLDRKSVV